MNYSKPFYHVHALRLARFLLIFIFISIQSAAQSNSSVISETEDFFEEYTSTQYLIIAGTSKNFHALEILAKNLSQKTGIAYYDMGRIYKDSCLVWPDSIDDELYRGCYVFRRWEQNAISLELDIDGVCFIPSESKDRPAMMVVAGMFGDKTEAKKRLVFIKKYVPSAYLLKKEVYMGCMH